MPPRVPPFLALASLLLVGSCVQSESPTQVDGPVALPLSIRPAVVESPANASALPINRIRLRAVRVADDVVVGETEVDASPDAAEWQIEFEVTATSDPTEVEVFVLLLNADADSESVEFSGIAGPIAVVAGETVEVPDVDLVRGPLDNVFVTGVSITESPDTIYEGASAVVRTEVTTSADVEPVVYLTALDEVLTAGDSMVTGAAPGVGLLAASSGAFGDTASIVVRPAPTAIDLDPDSASVAGPGEQASFTAVVTDARSDTLTDETVTWRSATPDIVTSLGDGLFEAVSVGTATVEAVSDVDASVVGSATLVVEDPTPRLSIVATPSDPSPADGSTVQVTVGVGNAPDGGDATVVEVTHRAGPGLTLLQAVPAQGTYEAQTGVWSLGSLAAGATAGLVLDFEVAPGTSGQTLTDSLWISSSNPVDPEVSDDTVSVSLLVGARDVDVAVLKEVDDAQPPPGASVVFTVSVANNGPGTVTNVAVHDSLHAIFESPTHTLSTGALVGDTLWTIPSLAEGDTATWTTTATVSASSGGTLASNTATLRSLDQNDIEAANDQATVDVVVAASDLALTAVPDDATPADGDTVQVTVSVVNGAGAADASGIEISHKAGMDLTVLAATPGQGTYDPQTGVWSVGTLAAGATAGLVLDLGVAVGTAGLTLTDSAWVSSTTPVDPDATDDTASVALSVAPRNVDVAVSKSVDDPQPLPGSTVSFTVTVANNGPGPVTEVAVYDSLDVIFESATHTLSGGALVGDTLWTISSLAAGATATWSTTATVSGNAAGTSATNTAILRSLAQADTTATNDTTTVLVDVPLSQPPGVTITAPADSSVFDPGELVTFSASASDPEEGDVSPSIQWASDLDGALATGASFETDLLSTGVHAISATATDSDGGTGVDSITVTVALYSVPATLNVPFGGTASLPISLTEPAPAGGITLSVTSSDETVTAPQSSTVFIPEGSQSANATLDGIAPGTADVSVSSAEFGVVTSVVSVTAELNILSSSVRFPTTFTQDIDIQLESQGSPLAAPTGGLTVSFTSRDAACVAEPASVTIPEGLISTTATLQYGGASDVLPCTTFVLATAPDIQTDSVQVTVDSPPGISMTTNRTLGSGLQEAMSVSLEATLPDGDTLTIASSSRSVLLAPNRTTEGSDTLKLVGPLNSTSFYAQALEGFTGQAIVEATAPNFNGTESTVTVVQPGVRIRSVPSGTTTLSNDDPIYADIGPQSNGSLTDLQAVRAGGPALTVTFISTEGAVATLKTLEVTNDTVTAQIQPGAQNTPTSVSTGGVAVDPLTQGSTSVFAEAAGYVSIDTATVTVSAPSISMTTNRTLGSGLQEAMSVSLEATLPDGDTLTIASSSRSVLLAPNRTTEGSDTLRLVGPLNSTSFYAQALEGFTGQAIVEATAPNFNGTESTVTVVQPGVRIRSVPSGTTTLSNDDPVYADIGPQANGSLTDLQAVRAGGPALTVTFISTEGAVATLKTLEVTNDTVTAQIQPGAQNTPTSVSGGGAALDPLTEGTAGVFAEAVGYVSIDTATVTVSAPSISMTTNRTLGSGLQEAMSVSLEATLPDGDTLTIASSSRSVLLAPNRTTEGSDTLRLVGPLNSTSFYAQALEGFTGQAIVTATAPNFNGTESTVTVVQPGVRIRSVPSGTTTLSNDDPIFADIGPQGNGSLTDLQAVRAGGPGLTVTFISTEGAVATLKTLELTNDTVTAQIQPGAQNTPTSVSGGGAALDPLTEGTAGVFAEAVGYVSIDTATVTVSAPGISVTNRTLGSGLQEAMSVSLGATLPDGDTLTIVSSSPNVLLAPNATTEGSETLKLVGPFNSRSFYAQALEGFTGQVTVTASAPGFTDGTATVTVVEPGIRLRSVSTSYSVDGANDPIFADIGPESNGSLTDLQSIRIGGQPLTVTFTSSDGTVATLVTLERTTGTVTAQIQPGAQNSPTSVSTGGVALDPLTAGSTTVSVSATGFLPAGASVEVTINP